MSCKLHKLTGCRKEPAGISIDLLFIEASRLPTMPKTQYELGQSDSAYVEQAGDKVQYGEAFTFVDAANDKFVRMTGVVDTGMVEVKTVGEKGFESFVNTLKTYVSSTADEIRHNVETLVNCGCGWVIVGTKRGTTDRFVIGTNLNPVVVQVNGGTGTKAGDKNGLELTMESSDGMIFRTYPAALALPEVISPN